MAWSIRSNCTTRLVDVQLNALLALTFSFVSATVQDRPVVPSTPPAPTFQGGNGPVVAIDEAHKNTHTAGSPPFRGLVQLLQADGYRVRPIADAISDSSLAGVDVLLISQPGGWEGQDASLNDREVDRLLRWIKDGGSFLLILDHLPAPQNANRLTRALGVSEWENGYTMVAPSDSAPIANIIFWRADSLPAAAHRVGPTGPAGGAGYQGRDAVLSNHPVTNGLGPHQHVRRVVTFVGSAFRPPAGSDVLLTLPADAMSFAPAIVPNQVPRIDSATPRSAVGGWAQGAVMKMGRGRVALFGETGLFSGGPAGDNRIFILNVLHWLSGTLPANGGAR
jgi:hypothetical protein